jgi:group I intron endonuclease
MLKTGIYKITDTTTGTFYIGSSKHIRRRCSNHRGDLRRGAHPNRYLQRAWNKHGEQAFRFDTVLLCAERDLLFFEQRCIDALAPGFNLMKVATGGGWAHEQGSKEVFAAKSRALWQDPSYLEKQRPHLVEKQLVREQAQAARKRRQAERQEELEAGYEAQRVAGRARRQAKRKAERAERRERRLGRCVSITWKGKAYTVSELATELGVSAGCIYARVARSGNDIERFGFGFGFGVERVAKPPVGAANMNAKKVTFRGETKLLSEWAAEAGVTPSAVAGRLDRGWDMEKALTAERQLVCRKAKTYPFRGEERTTQEIADALGITAATVRNRMKEGLAPDEITGERRCQTIEYQGVSRSRAQWADHFKIKPARLEYLVRRYQDIDVLFEGLAMVRDFDEGEASA